MNWRGGPGRGGKKGRVVLPPPPVLPSAGTIVAVAGNQQVTISQSIAPSGFSGPVTLTLYRSLIEEALGTLVGTVTLPHVDTERTNGLPLYYTPRWSDGSTTLDGPQVGPVTPTAAPDYAPPDIFDADFSDGTITPFTLASGWAVPEVVPDPLDAAWGNVARIPYATWALNTDVDAALFYNLASRGYLKAGDPTVYTRFYVNMGTWTAGTKGSSDQRKIVYHKGDRNSDAEGRCALILTFFGYELRARQNAYNITTGVYDGFDNWGIFTAAENTRYCFEEQITPNSAHGVADGVYRLWIDGVLILEETGVLWFPTALHSWTSLAFGYQLQTATTLGSEHRYFGRIAASSQRIGP